MTQINFQGKTITKTPGGFKTGGIIYPSLDQATNAIAGK